MLGARKKNKKGRVMRRMIVRVKKELTMRERERERERR